MNNATTFKPSSTDNTNSWEEKLKVNKCAQNIETGQSFQLLCNSFTEEEWFIFLEDLFDNPSKIHTHLGIPRENYRGDEDPVIDIVTDFATLSQWAKDNLIAVIKNKYLSQEQIKTLDQQEEKTHKIFYIIAATPLNIKSQVLKEIMENDSLSENIRYKAALRLCNSKDILSILDVAFWQQVMKNSTSKPKFLHVVIKTLTYLNLNSAWELLRDEKLEKIPDEYYLGYEAAFREFLRKKYPDNGRTKQELYIKDYPSWSHECIEWTLKEKEFEHLKLQDSKKPTISRPGVEDLRTQVKSLGEKVGFTDITNKVLTEA